MFSSDLVVPKIEKFDWKKLIIDLYWIGIALYYGMTKKKRGQTRQPEFEIRIRIPMQNKCKYCKCRIWNKFQTILLIGLEKGFEGLCPKP